MTAGRAANLTLRTVVRFAPVVIAAGAVAFLWWWSSLLWMIAVQRAGAPHAGAEFFRMLTPPVGTVHGVKSWFFVTAPFGYFSACLIACTPLVPPRWLNAVGIVLHLGILPTLVICARLSLKASLALVAFGMVWWTVAWLRSRLAGPAQM